MDLTNNCTLQKFMTGKYKNQISYNNLSILETSESKEIFFSIHNLVDDYIDDILPLCEEVHLSQSEIIKYQYRPWLLAYDVYHEQEVYWLILVLNDMPSPNDFEDIETLKLPYVNDLSKILSMIYESEITYIARNRESLL